MFGVNAGADIQRQFTRNLATLKASEPLTGQKLGFGGLGFFDARFKALFAAMTFAVEFFFTFDFLVSHYNSP